MSFRSPFVPAVARRLGAAALAAAAILLVGRTALAADPAETGFIRRTFTDAAGEHGYVVYVPKDYTPDRAWPVMLFLHGAGERGDDGFRQAEVGLGPMIRRWGTFPWIVVFPQAEDTRGPIKSVWAPDAPDGRRALAILDEVESTYNVDPEHRVLTGWSMGGRGTYMLAAAYPEKWSAALPIAGWADADLAERLAKVPLWSFHGTADALVSFEEDKALIEAIRAAGGNPLFTVMEGEGHYIWRTVYASPAVFEWMRNPTIPPDGVPPALDPLATVELPLDQTAGPFVPAIEVDNAVAIRLGPDLFDDLSEIAEDIISKQPLTGSMPATTTESAQGCITFDVRASRLSYRVPVTSVDLSPTDAGSIRLKLSVANARLVIGRTDVRGGLVCAATAGPMHVVLGHRRPIPVEVDAVPYVTEDEFRLKTKSVRFSIPRDNWYVTKPAVDTNSPFLPAGRVATSLVEGIYTSKDRIERDFRKSVADAINEQKLELPPVSDDQLLTALWPVPAYRPRIKPRLQDVSVDADGLVVLFGLTVAAVDPFDPPPLSRVDLKLTRENIEKGDLAVTAAENLVAPLTKQLIDAGLAHINVLDIPGDSYAHLADREMLARAIPALRDLPRTAEVRTELYLREPLGLGGTDAIEQVCTPDGCFSLFNLRMPDLTAVISVRNASNERWRDFAEFSYDVTQPVRLGIGAEAERGREVVIACAGSPTTMTSGRWLGVPPADDRLDEEAAADLFERGWSKSSYACGPNSFVIPDLELRGYVRRLERLEPGTRGMSAVFEEPETVVSNASEIPLVYRTKRGADAWSEPETLLPGESRAYRVSRPLGYASEMSDNPERFTLPPGRDATFDDRPEGPPGLRLDPAQPPADTRQPIPGTGG